MNWEIFVSCLALSFVILFLLSIKWEIPLRISLPASFLIGLIAGLIVSSLAGLFDLGFFLALIFQLLLIMIISLSLIIWRFYRDPVRVPPEDKNSILSPADGKVIYVKRIEKGLILYSEKKGKKFSLNDFIKFDVLPSEGFLIGISQNFLHAHINRAPIGGRVFLIHHIKGGFSSLKKKEAVILNERALTVFDNGLFKIGVVQIASRLVRQIVIYFDEGHKINKGEKWGMIRFGSQVDLVLPDLPSLSIGVKPGDDVKAGISVVAKIAGDIF